MRETGVQARRSDWPVLAALVGVAVAWGLSFVVVKDAVASAAPGAVVGWRFGVAAVVLIMLRPRSIMIINRVVLGRGVLLGTLLGSGFLLCTYGMRTVPVITSAFIVGTTVVFTPVVSWWWLRHRVPGRTKIAVGLAVGGLALLTLRGTGGGAYALLILVAALLWAVHLCGLGRWVTREQVYASTVVQLATAALLAVAVSLAVGDALWLPDAAAVGQMVFLGGVATAAAFVTVTWAQTRVDATTTAVLLTLEPVAGAVAAVALGETLTVSVLLGAVTVLAASALVAPRTATTPGVRTRAGTDIAQDGDHVVPRTDADREPAAGIAP